MIHASTDRKWLPLYEALASDVRLQILDLLAEQEMNVKELAQTLGLSSAIVTMHVKKLEAGGLIHTALVRKQGGTHKMCTLAVSRVEIQLPQQDEPKRVFDEVSIPIGHYTRFEVQPTCGLATADHTIGQYDDPRYFLEPERMHAKILWFGSGFVEYRIPNYLLPSQTLEEIEISLELGSEAPGIAENWPSDIHFYVNDTLLGYWTSPGDSGQGRGHYTPSWWPDSINQYGWLKVIRITEEGTFLDGQRLSNVTIKNIRMSRNEWTLRIEVPEHAVHVGGLTLYGEGFGNYNRDIIFRTYRR
ncbi:ArsR family transcriptional regulator [Paenibacillus sp. CGMCC 1.16610]|uniref:ArsR family transcriptional regulator n=1 Tax=Paenibacillus anseongense TaxID=2682845 RepID=A0ABW9U2A6_9BACL|nr:MULTISPECIES: ArsR family transcriptional regulator [Paenibacillus]MBA2943082.1 ArsR family transcriptional regulator [Paenibacillus sp. CGMCC 1.16610]MVQ33578.1 ArsR family transcriptional regulator [Paenibacillus anseongense]